MRPRTVLPAAGLPLGAPDQLSPEGGEPFPPLRALLRAALAILLSVGVCWALWQLAPSRLSVRTGIVGYPIFSGFNYPRYFDAYYLIAFVFPALAVALYALGSWRGPLAASHRIMAQRPIVIAPEPVSNDAVGGSGWSYLWGASRVALPAFVVAIEVTARTPHSANLTLSTFLPALGYVAVVLLGAVLLARRGESFLERVARMNSALCLVALPLLLVVSSATNVTITTPLRVVDYPWFPWWLALIAAFSCATWRVVSGHRAVPARGMERSALGAIVGSVFVFLATAALPSALNVFEGFDDGTNQSGAQLVFYHGLAPWRGVYLTHGLLEDAIDALPGFVTFSHTVWGVAAGIGIFTYPVGAVTVYLFALYFARRRGIAPAICAIALAAGQFVLMPRFIFLPLLLIAYDKVISTRSRRWCALLAFGLLAESILSPEIMLFAAVILVGVAGFEWSTRRREDAIVRRYFRTIWTVAFGIVQSVAWGVYLVATGSLGGFIDYFRFLGSGHALWGALPLQWSLSKDLVATTQLVLPVVLVLATIWRISRKTGAGRSWSTRDWSLVVSAGFVLVYYQKGLDRADAGHIAEVFGVSTFLIVLWGIELLEVIDGYALRLADAASSALRAVRSHTRSEHGGGRTVGLLGSPMAPAFLILTSLVMPGVISSVSSIPSRYHAYSPVPPPPGRLGYTVPGTINTKEISELGTVLDAYAPTGSVFDFANEPGVVYFLLNRTPGTRFFHIEAAQTPAAQQQAVSELEVSRPRLVVFTDYNFGLPVEDLILGPIRQYIVSRYVLTHYRPLTDVNGQLVMIRSDLVHEVPPISSLHLSNIAAASKATYFSTYNCEFGQIPDFLSPPSLTGAVIERAVLAGGAPINTVIDGWAVDDKKLVPVREVYAVADGRVVASAVPGGYRDDIVTYFHTTAVAESGFELRFYLKPGKRATVYARNADGTVSQIQPEPGLKLARSLHSSKLVRAITATNGARLHVETGSWLSGWVNSDTKLAPSRVYKLTAPRNEPLSLFAWAKFTMSSGAGTTDIVIDDQTSSAGHEMGFTRSPGDSKLFVPVGSCPQWFGYGRSVYLEELGPALPSLTVTLYR